MTADRRPVPCRPPIRTRHHIDLRFTPHPSSDIPAPMNNGSLHHAIVSFFLERQRAPSIQELAAQFQCDVAQARAALKVLADHHGVVLHPGSDAIWVAHPFSAAPTTFVVRSGGCTW